MLEDGSWQRPHRARRRDEFVPIEEVSEEDLHPDYLSRVASPEDELIRREEEEGEVSASVDPELANEFATEEVLLTEKAEDRVRMEVESAGADTDVKEPPVRPPRLKTQGSARGEGGYGRRGREHPGKHKKGSDTIRRHEGLTG